MKDTSKEVLQAWFNAFQSVIEKIQYQAQKHLQYE